MQGSYYKIRFIYSIIFRHIYKPSYTFCRSWYTFGSYMLCIYNNDGTNDSLGISSVHVKTMHCWHEQLEELGFRFFLFLSLANICCGPDIIMIIIMISVSLRPSSLYVCSVRVYLNSTLKITQVECTPRTSRHLIEKKDVYVICPLEEGQI